MKEDNFLLVVAIAAVFVSLVAAGFTYFSMSNLVERITGYATAQVNLSVESIASINFTTDFINFGSGQVNPGVPSASLTTINNVSGGNWSLQKAGGLRIENIGNINVTLNLSVGKTPAAFIGGTNPAYEWNISNVESNSCANNTGLSVLGLGLQSTASTTTKTVCSPLVYLSGSDSIRIDINLTVPSDSIVGALTDTITATAIA